MPDGYDPTPPLDYRPPGTDGEPGIWLGLSFTAGMIAAGLIAAVVCWGAVAMALGVGDSGGKASFLVTGGILFVGGAAASVTFFRRVARGRTLDVADRRRRSRFFVLGLLLGLGLAGLLQGLCFGGVAGMNV